MLSLIRIKNYAIIDEIELELNPGFNVMTGETGAGKSILVDALGLALGDRADASAVRSGASRAEITVLFECTRGHPAMRWLEERELDEDEFCALRRVISAEGRSRAFVNNQPIALQDLRTLGSLLVDIHGQHAHQSLLRPAEQRRLLDASGSLSALAEECGDRFKEWRQAQDEKSEFEAQHDDRAGQIELLQFQLKDLEELGLREGEIEELRREHGRLANIDRFAHNVQNALDWLYENEEMSAHSLIARAKEALEELSELDSKLNDQTRQLDAAEIEIRDIASALVRYRDTVEPDPERLQYLETRLARIRSLSNRHRIDEESLHALEARLRAALDQLADDSRSPEALEARLQQARKAYFVVADRLSKARRKHAAKLAETVTAQLRQLGLPDGLFQVHIEDRPSERIDSNGLDYIEFQIRLNPGHRFGAIGRIASGGELSRISLALAVVDTSESTIPTFVFDEVDAGIGGGVAEIVGQRLRDIASQHQVLCVTHLPQVASQGEHHYRITKLSDGHASRTNIRRLSTQERVDELSRMLGGLKITERTRAHAEEMISRAAKKAMPS